MQVALRLASGDIGAADCASARTAARQFDASSEAGTADARFAHAIAGICEAEGAARASALNTYAATVPPRDFRHRLLARISSPAATQD